MARQRSPPNKQTPLNTKSHANIAHSTAKKARAAHKAAKDKQTLYQIARRNALAQKRGPRKTFEVDTSLFEPNPDYSEDEESVDEEDSSEGEDWEDGNTLISKFMEVDRDGPQNTEDDLINLVESLKVPFGKSHAALRQDLKDVIAPTMDLIGETHRAISEQKGPDSRMHEGAQKFLEYVPELTQTIVKSQAEFELARAKCENTISALFEKLKQAHEKKRQNELDYGANFKAKVKFMMEIHDEFDGEIDQLEIVTSKKLKGLAKLDSQKKVQNILSIIS